MAEDEELLNDDETEEVLDSEEEISEPEPEPEVDSTEPSKTSSGKSLLPMIIIGIVIGLIIGIVVGMLMAPAEDDEDLKNQVEDLEAQVDDLEANLTNKVTEISNLQSDINDNQVEIGQLQAAISENQSKLTDNITRLANANENITMLNDNITGLMGNINTLDQEIMDLNDEITENLNEIEVLEMEADLRGPHIIHLQSPYLNMDCANCHDIDGSGGVIIREDYFYDETDLTDHTFRRDVDAGDCARCHGPFPTEGIAMTEDYVNVTWLQQNSYTESCISASPCHETTWYDDMDLNPETDDVDLDYIETQVTGADIETITETCLSCHGGNAWYMEGH
jgi:gas vesicle protein